MIIISNEATEEAFDAYLREYAVGQDSRGWFVPGQIGLYGIGEKAFTLPGSYEDFTKLYNQLKGGWQVFRNAHSRWSDEEAFARLMALDRRVRSLSLSTIKDGDWPDIWKTVVAVRDIKCNKSRTPSLVAISKFLHFWNPRLFVIFDSEVMEYYVFRHQWIELPPDRKLSDLCGTDVSADPRLAKYMCVLRYASEFARGNAHMRAGLVAAARRAPGVAAVPAEFEAYEAVAFEWLIIGLVESPPSGVDIRPDPGASQASG